MIKIHDDKILAHGRKTQPISKLSPILDRTTTGKVILPANCRFAFQNRSRGLYVIEYAPHVRAVPYSEVRHKIDNRGLMITDHVRTSYSIALPYTVLAIALRLGRHARLEGVFCYFRNAPLKDVNSPLYIAGLPNIYRNAIVCMGRGLEEDEEKPIVDTSDRLRKTIGDFWNRDFNDALQTILWPIQEWHNKTVKNPEAAIREVLQRFKRRKPTGHDSIANHPWNPVGTLNAARLSKYVFDAQ